MCVPVSENNERACYQVRVMFVCSAAHMRWELHGKIELAYFQVGNASCWMKGGASLSLLPVESNQCTVATALRTINSAFQGTDCATNLRPARSN